jgi:hypothetical protein
VSDDEQIEVTFLVGEWMPASDLVEMLRRDRGVIFVFANDPPADEDEDEVEFVSPSVPGRRVRRNPSKED